MGDRRSPPPLPSQRHNYDREDRERYFEEALEVLDDRNDSRNIDDRSYNRPPPSRNSRQANNYSPPPRQVNEDFRREDYGRNSRVSQAAAAVRNDDDYGYEEHGRRDVDQQPSRNDIDSGFGSGRNTYNENYRDRRDDDRWNDSRNRDQPPRRYNDNDERDRYESNATRQSSRDLGYVRNRAADNYRDEHQQENFKNNDDDYADSRFSRNDENLRHADIRRQHSGARNQSSPPPPRYEYEDSRNNRGEPNRNISIMDYRNDRDRRDRRHLDDDSPRMNDIAPARRRNGGYPRGFEAFDDEQDFDGRGYDRDGQRQSRVGRSDSRVAEKREYRRQSPHYQVDARPRNSNPQYFERDNIFPSSRTNDRRDRAQTGNRYSSHNRRYSNDSRNNYSPAAARVRERSPPPRNDSPRRNDPYESDARRPRDYDRRQRDVSPDQIDYAPPRLSRNEMIRRDSDASIRCNDQDRGYPTATKNREDSNQTPTPTRDEYGAVLQDDHYRNTALPRGRDDYDPAWDEDVRQNYPDNQRSGRQENFGDDERLLVRDMSDSGGRDRSTGAPMVGDGGCDRDEYDAGQGRGQHARYNEAPGPRNTAPRHNYGGSQYPDNNSSLSPGGAAASGGYESRPNETAMNNGGGNRYDKSSNNEYPAADHEYPNRGQENDFLPPTRDGHAPYGGNNYQQNNSRPHNNQTNSSYNYNNRRGNQYAPSNNDNEYGNNGRGGYASSHGSFDGNGRGGTGTANRGAYINGRGGGRGGGYNQNRPGNCSGGNSTTNQTTINSNTASPPSLPTPTTPSATFYVPPPPEAASATNLAETRQQHPPAATAAPPSQMPASSISADNDDGWD